MKIKSIAALCKKSKVVQLVNHLSDSGEVVQQYIGDGTALYPVTGLPILDEESILTIFDIPEKQKSDWSVREHTELPGVSLEDLDLSDKLIEKQFIVRFDYAGINLKPMPTSRGIVFVDSKYLTPVLDTADILEFYERKTPSGDIYIVVKAGLLFQALIVPYIVPPILEGQIRYIANHTWDDGREKQEIPEPEDSYRINPQTGEIVEG